MAARPPKRRAVDAPVGSGLALLPSHIAQSILLSAVPLDELEMLTIDNARIAQPVESLAMVSKQWRTLALNAASNVALSTLAVSITTRKRRELLELRRQLTLRRRFLLTLEIEEIPDEKMIRANQWAAVLSCVPRLEVLDLQGLPYIAFAQMGALVGAAGQQCTNLQSLLVSAPHENNRRVFYPTHELRRKLSDPLYYTMEQVFKKSNHVVLRHLCVCMRFDLQGLKYTRKYMDKVLQFCPNLKQFDGFQAAVDEMQQRLCHEQWFMDIDLWTRFCATLTKLVDFQWICVPFATRFFEIFGQHPKPQMKRMVLTAAMNWGWYSFMQDVGPRLQQQLTDTGFAGAAKNAHAALRACPNLTDLQVYWYHQKLGPVPSHLQRSVTNLEGVTMMDPEIFGDEFWEAAVRVCPYLTTVVMMPVDEKKANAIVHTFTDRSLRVIVKLGRLEIFAAQSVNVTGDGIFDLVINPHVPEHGRVQQFYICFGDEENDANDLSFYEVITRFVERLLAADAPLPCVGRKISLKIANQRRTPVGRTWSETYLATLRSLTDQVHEKHREIGVTVFTSECDGTGFAQINEVTFDSSDELTQQRIKRGDRAVGGSIWNRNIYRHEFDDEDSALYFDEDDDDDENPDRYNDSDSETSEENAWGNGSDGDSDDDDDAL